MHFVVDALGAPGESTGGGGGGGGGGGNGRTGFIDQRMLTDLGV